MARTFLILLLAMVLGGLTSREVQAAPPVSNAQSYFVAKSGSDSNAGTMQAPFLTIGKGLTSAAGDASRKNVLVAAGTYAESLNLPSGVSLYGGFSASAAWLRSSENVTTITAFGTTVSAIGYTNAGVLEGFTIVSTGSAAGQNSTALYLNNAPALSVRFNTLQSGPAGHGTNGASSSAVGASGGNGMIGATGCSNCSGFGAGGAGGLSSCGAGGGAGGNGGNNTASGQNGSLSQNGGPGGLGAASSGCFGGGNNGTSAPNGAGGAFGSAGTGGNGGSVIAGLWATNSGGNGGLGGAGIGGGGGGGGGGGRADTVCNADGGGGGGGGGAGGCGGGGGSGGMGGGGSFGIFAHDSGSVVVINNTITAGNGGQGGHGGSGAVGGDPGTGNSGGGGPDDAGGGGSGGNGGMGGIGGGGGGGAGGPSISVFSSGTTNVSMASNTLWNGFGGQGGGGGGANGNAGANGPNPFTSGATTARPFYQLSVVKWGSGSGTVMSVFGGVNCGDTCGGLYGSGAEIELVATPAPGSYFAGWSDGCTGTGTCTVTMDQARGPRAQFKLDSTIPRLLNISTRGPVLTGDNVMIGGFIIGGSSSKTVVVRARGPSLAQFGVPGTLSNPQVQLFSGQTQVGFNDNWVDAPNKAAIEASSYAPENSQESAILMSLAPGPYTAIVTGVGSTTGIAIVEVFEVDGPTIPLINISTRGIVQSGDNVMIGGFIITGDGPQTVVVRARGPSLAQFGVPNTLPNPHLQLFSGQTQIAFNDNWGDASNKADIQASGQAPGDPNESAILITLQPGPYTAIVTGVGGATGIGIVEVFRVECTSNCVTPFGGSP